MNDALQTLSPKQRLALSRAALLAAMGVEKLDSEAGPRPVRSTTERGPADDRLGKRVEAKIRHSFLASWWRHSHLSTAAELGMPFLQAYAASHPLKLAVHAAAVGSLFVLLRPWRLLSLGMAVGLVMRSTNVPGLVSDYFVPRRAENEATTLDEASHG